ILGRADHAAVLLAGEVEGIARMSGPSWREPKAEHRRVSADDLDQASVEVPQGLLVVAVEHRLSAGSLKGDVAVQGAAPGVQELALTSGIRRGIGGDRQADSRRDLEDQFGLTRAKQP